MASYLSNTSGAWDANVWDTMTNTPTLHASTNVTAGTLYSQAFDAPGLTDSATAVLVYITGLADSGGDTVTLTLQEYNGAAWNDTAATVTRNKADVTQSAWNHFRVGTPYTFTTLTAGYYRWKITQTGTSITFAADSGGSIFAYASFDDRTGFPAAGHAAWIVSDTTSDLTITITGTELCENTAGRATVLSQRTLETALYVSSNGKLAFDKSGSDRLESKGNIFFSVDSSVDADYSVAAGDLTIEMEHLSASGDYGIYVYNPKNIDVIGKAKSTTELWKTNYASGDGATGTELVTSDAVDWDVDDRIVITSTDTYNHLETKYIKTKVDASTYTLADTPGGAESALSYTHLTTAHIINEERNIKVTAKNTSYGYYFNNLSTGDRANNVWQWIQFTYPGGTVGSRRGVQLTSSGSTDITFDYNVCIDPVNWWGLSTSSSKATKTFTGLIQDGGDWFYMGAPNTTYEDPVVLRARKIGFDVLVTSNVTINNGISNGNNYMGASYWGGGLINSNGFTCYNTDFQANRNASMSLNVCSDVRFLNCTVGNVASDNVNVYGAFDVTNQALFQDCLFDTGITLYSNHNDLNSGSEVKFHAIDQVDNVNRWYMSGGIWNMTGAGLTDTTTLTAGSFCLGGTVEDVTEGLWWEFLIPAKVGETSYANGLAQKNASMAASDALVELFMPGSVVADSTYYLPYDSDINDWSVAALYLGTTDDFAKVRVTAKSVTSGAKFYVDSIFNGTDELNGIDLWHEGKPAGIMLVQAGDPIAVWQVPTSALTMSGTIGKYVATKLLSVAKFLGLK